MKSLLNEFWHDENGASSIEYALVGSVVSIAIAATLYQMGPMLVEKYQSVSDAFGE